jgi:predicted ATPase
VSLPEGRYPALTLTPQQQRQQTLDALVAWLVAEAERHPVLAVYEDVHWADPSTLELLGTLIEETPTAPMLYVLTFRPAFVPPWSPRAHITPLTLNRLDRPQVEALIRHLTGGKALPAEVVQHLVTRTDGVPLFVEELTRMFLESGLLREEEASYALTRSLASVPIPTTLHDSLMARLDRLSAAKEIAQLGAVLGREFSYALIQALTPLAEALTAFEASRRDDMLTEAYRLKGEFLLRQSVPDMAQAEACFQQAFTIARRQQAKSWELRTALSLNRLWQQQGKRAEAHELLAPIYGWFTEGFDTADLQEAKGLLADLGGEPDCHA